MQVISVDFETRSGWDISAGSWRYAEDESTEVLCCAVKPWRKPPKLWVPPWLIKEMDAVAANPKAKAFKDKDYAALAARWKAFKADRMLGNKPFVRSVQNADRINAFNSGFEQAIFEKQLEARFNMPHVPKEKYRCSAARAAMCALPRKLGDIAQALGLDVQKDMDGRKVMMKLCKPRAPRKAEKEAMARQGCEEINGKQWYHPESECYIYHWWAPEEVFEDFLKLFEYCLTDTETEEAVARAIPELPEKELAIWRLDQKINRRGVYVDIPLADKNIAFLQRTEREMLKELRTLTGGAVQTGKQTDKSKKWLAANGLTLYNLTKDTVKYHLARKDIPDVCRQFLELRRALARASTAKYAAMKLMVCADGRIRNLFRYHGAGTGRFAGLKLQVQNLPRGKFDFDDYELAIEFMHDANDDLLGCFFGCDKTAVSSTLIRPTLIAAPGKDLLASDYSSIEGRVLAWAAGERHVLEHYDEGRDMYIVAATSVYGGTYDQLYEEYKPEDGSHGDKSKRTVGKPTELGLGYGGGIGAFASMAEVYGIDLETLPEIVNELATTEELEKAERMASSFLKTKETEAKKKGIPFLAPMTHEAAMSCDIIKQRWRADRQKTVRFWHILERAAIAAVRSPGQVFAARGAKFCVKGKYLKMLLPSGRLLYYYDPRLSVKKTSWGQKKEAVTYMALDEKGQWRRTHTYGGKLCENFVQAVARDILTDAMLNLDERGYDLVLHVHDEGVCEVDKDKGSVEEFEAIMGILPEWAVGLPLKAAGGWRGKRFRKD